jgi:hypothetical protein
MIDIKRFNRVREKGLAKIQFGPEGYELVFKRFDPESGEELQMPERQKVNPKELQDRRAELLKEVGGIEAILTELGVPV